MAHLTSRYCHFKTTLKISARSVKKWRRYLRSSDFIGRPFCFRKVSFFFFFFFFSTIFHFSLRSADKVGRPFCFCSVSYYYFFSSFLFFFTAICEPRFLHHFSTNFDEIWHVDSPWWDEQTEYFFKSIGPGVGIRRGPKVLLCFIIGKTLYTVRRDKNFT